LTVGVSHCRSIATAVKVAIVINQSVVVKYELVSF
jgi:hypothetical protein